MDEIDIFTDGACSGNPGPGGWGAILRAGPHEKELWGGEPATTNNRMELLAVIRALQALKRPVAALSAVADRLLWQVVHIPYEVVGITSVAPDVPALLRAIVSAILAAP